MHCGLPRCPEEMKSIDESKMPETTVVGAGDSGGNDPHGDVSRADVTQDVSDIQHGDDDDDIHDWNSEVLNHVLVEILDKERVDAHASDDFCWCPIQGRLPVPRYPRLGIREEISWFLST